MNDSRFDAWTRRRFGLVVGGTAAALLGFGDGLHGLTWAKNKNNGKTKNKRGPKLNSFGCVDVGNPCRGDDRLCCSGMCQGRKPKKGRKDRSTCVAHNVLGCQSDQDFCGGIIVMCGANGTCVRTTGKASFCAAGGPCMACRKDKDCEADFGPGAACTVCDSCDGINGSSGTGCVPAAV